MHSNFAQMSPLTCPTCPKYPHTSQLLLKSSIQIAANSFVLKRSLTFSLICGGSIIYYLISLTEDKRAVGIYLKIFYGHVLHELFMGKTATKSRTSIEQYLIFAVIVFNSCFITLQKAFCGISIKTMRRYCLSLHISHQSNCMI